MGLRAKFGLVGITLLLYGRLHQVLGHSHETAREGTRNLDQSPVSLSSWSLPSSESDNDLMEILRPIVLGLGPDNLRFNPSILIVDGEQYCANVDDKTCERNCVMENRFCAVPDPKYSNISGRSLVIESARRACIWETHGRESHGQTEGVFWNYLKELRTTGCDQVLEDQCIDKTYRLAGVGPHHVRACLDHAGGFDSDRNNILRNLVRKAELANITEVPVLKLNGNALSADVVKDQHAVFDRICSAYEEGEAPELCSICRPCKNLDVCLTIAKCLTPAERTFDAETESPVSRSTPNFTGIILGLVVIVACLYLCRRLSSRELVTKRTRERDLEFVLDMFDFESTDLDEHDEAVIFEYPGGAQDHTVQATIV